MPDILSKAKHYLSTHLPGQMSKPWTCLICVEEYTNRPIKIGDEDVCSDCLHQFFENAITTESNFPARWGTKRIHPREFSRFLSADLVKRYKQKEKEWSIPPGFRFYCNNTDPPRRPQECGHFLGRWMDSLECQRCEKCMWYTCLRCKMCFSSSDSKGKRATIDHECDPSIEQELSERAFDGLEKGVHYQDCPSRKCKRRIELKEACNHMICLCGTEFCYLCGQKAKKHSGHWSKGGCPLWGRTGAGVFQHDDDADMEDDDLDAEEQARIEWQLREIERQVQRLRMEPRPRNRHDRRLEEQRQREHRQRQHEDWEHQQRDSDRQQAEWRRQREEEQRWEEQQRHREQERRQQEAARRRHEQPHRNRHNTRTPGDLLRDVRASHSPPSVDHRGRPSHDSDTYCRWCNGKSNQVSDTESRSLPKVMRIS